MIMEEKFDKLNSFFSSRNPQQNQMTIIQISSKFYKEVCQSDCA